MRPIRKNYFLDKAYDAAKEMSTAHFAERKLIQIANRGIKLDWRKSQHDITQELTDALIDTGTNKYMADVAAKHIYESIAPSMKAGKLPVLGAKRQRLIPKATAVRGGMESEKRKKEDGFNRKKNRISDKVADELRNFDYDGRKSEEEYIKMVKLSWAYKAAVRDMPLNDSERMAVELARIARRKRQFERGRIGWKDVQRK